jgi:hypothetical protein
MEEHFKAEEFSDVSDQYHHPALRKSRSHVLHSRSKLPRPEKRFETLQNNYISSGMSHQSQLFLRRIVSSAPNGGQSLLEKLNDTCKQVLLNELEIVLWSFHLEKYVWYDDSSPQNDLLLISAFAAKQFLNSDTSAILANLQTLMPDFEKRFKQWAKDKPQSVSHRDMNIRYYELSIPIRNFEDSSIVDYNQYVTQLLDTNHSHKREEKESEIEEEIPNKRAKGDMYEMSQETSDEEEGMPNYQFLPNPRKRSKTDEMGKQLKSLA